MGLDIMDYAGADTAKVFQTGRSQAVRLPKAYRFDTAEVTIQRQGDAVILRPKVQSREQFWDELEKSFHGFDGLPLLERKPTLLREPVKFE